MTEKKLKFEGVFTALITPFAKDNEIDKEGLRKVVEHAIEGGVSGVVPCGTTGESATLSSEEHRTVIEMVVEYSKVLVIAGTGSNNTREAVVFTHHAEAAGADAVLVITPYYNKPNRNGLIKHYEKIAAVAEIPIILYNVPSRTGLNMTADVVAELANIPEIVGIKEASGNLEQVAEIIQLTEDQDFFVLSGNDMLTLPIMTLGGRGVISVTANVVPRMMSDMVKAMLKEKYSDARVLHYKLMPVFKALFLETNPIPVKKAAEIIGLIETEEVRLPLGKLSWENEDELIKVLKDIRAH